MNIAVWIVSGLLALLYLFTGGAKMLRSKAELAQTMSWTRSASPAIIKVVGTLEILGAIGLILPWLTGIAPILTPIAAIGLVLLQAVAIVIHIRIREAKSVPFNATLLLLAAFVAVFRFMGS
ncbi:DoxX family protein [Microbacterium sp. NPDC090281]|uniref:DoxX family protein n=1 Tax=Microbacterium sp. NPDC090281 TaxID=3364208 RepID=UPI0038186060